MIISSNFREYHFISLLVRILFLLHCYPLVWPLTMFMSLYTYVRLWKNILFAYMIKSYFTVYLSFIAFIWSLLYQIYIDWIDCYTKIYVANQMKYDHIWKFRCTVPIIYPLPEHCNILFTTHISSSKSSFSFKAKLKQKKNEKEIFIAWLLMQ